MKKYYVLVFAIYLLAVSSFAQVGINSDNSAPDPSAMLDVNSTNKGFLAPRMTQLQMSSIDNPANGLIVFCTTDSKLYIFTSSFNQWKEVNLGLGSVNTTPIQSCGIITINHVTTFGVAPVNKTVTYELITNIPGEPNKCWITSNLGADHSANDLADISEESAGWYWQFNLKKGYKHDGSNRIPNTTWIININEMLHWQPSQDPCKLELGDQWRIPSYLEWYNVDNTGDWTNWTGSWGSGLKLHAAGYLHHSNGSLDRRGSNGYYWSSTQNSTDNGWNLYFNSVSSGIYSNDKANGFSARCLRDN